VPFAVTVDYESLEEGTVTIRNRDNTEQKRIPISDISDVLDDLMNYGMEFEDL
jgi:glycyl-tRNA synthetase